MEAREETNQMGIDEEDREIEIPEEAVEETEEV